MKMPRLTHSLHFRMSALFLVLLGISIGGYYLWIDATVFKAYSSKEEEGWFEKKEEPELAGLALEAGKLMDDRSALRERVQSYGRTIAPFGAEIALFDTLGTNLESSGADSQALAISSMDPNLLRKMTGDQWDFSSYPLNGNIDSYENRIIDVAPVHLGANPDSPVIGYLAASIEPITIEVGEMESDWRSFGFRALVLMLIYAIITALIIMAWASRRIRNLTRGVEVFTAGHFDHRVAAGSADEIGTLGRHFNTMASNIQTMMNELGAKEQFQRQLIANVSHDLRTPLASLRGYIETLSLDPDNLTRKERSHFLEIIFKNLDHLDKLIERTLILSRLESGQTHLRREEFPLGELADAVLMRCKSIAAGQEVNLELEMGEDPQGFQVTADALQVSQALQNLVENGIKFNRPGGNVTLRLVPHPATIEIQISDTGRGIPAEDLPHIFDRFYIGKKSRTRAALQKKESGRASQSTSNGLGLAIAHKIITSHGSVLNVTSEPGRGTVFSFHLPRADAHGSEIMTADA